MVEEGEIYPNLFEHLIKTLIFAHCIVSILGAVCLFVMCKK